MLKRLGIIFTSIALAAFALAGPAGAKSGSSASSTVQATLTVGHSTKAPVARIASRKRNHRHTRAHATAAPGSVPSHIATWAYDDCGNGGSNASATLVRQWVSYAEANCGQGGDSKALSDCHASGTTYCDSIQYLDTNWIYAQGSPPWSSFKPAASENWYQHVPGSRTTRIRSNSYGGGYLINQANPGVQSFFRRYVRSSAKSDDGLMMDDESASTQAQLYYSDCGCKSTDEAGSDAALQADHGDMAGAMTHSNGTPFLQIDNALAPSPYQPQGLKLLNQSNKVVGLISEGAPESDGTLDPYYSTLLDQIAYVSDKSSGFVVPLSYAQAGASYQQQSRRVQEATMLLGYSAGHLVDWADLEQGSNDLGVWPEEGIVPINPVQSMAAPGGRGCLAGTGNVCSTGGHNDVQVAPGVYRREFRACYDHGTAFGACASVVNTTGGPVTVKSSWLTQSYGHQITFNGGDVQSGGAVNLAGSRFAVGSTTVGSHDAVLLAR